MSYPPHPSFSPPTTTTSSLNPFLLHLSHLAFSLVFCSLTSFTTSFYQYEEGGRRQGAQEVALHLDALEVVVLEEGQA